MLTHLRFDSFKSWKRVDLELAPLTFLYGANSSGKSSILQFLLLLKQTKDSPDRTIALDFGGEDSLVDAGSYRDAVHGHDLEQAMEWQLGWTTPESLDLADPAGKRSKAVFSGNAIEVSASARLRNKVVVGEHLEYRFSGARFGLRRSRDRAGFRLEYHGDQSFKFLRTIGRAWDLPGPTKSYAFPDQAKTYFQNSQFLSEFETAYVRQMDAILHLGPLRDYPKRQYIWAGSSPVDVGRHGERTIDAILAATERHEKLNTKPKGRLRSFQAMIAWWLQELGLISSFEVSEVASGSGLYRALVRRSKLSPETSITDVGFGVSQVLPAIVLLCYAPEGSTVVLEQPEIHLHPAVQSGLADVIATMAKARGIQVIVESHSEHLLQRLLRRIAEGEKAPHVPISTNDIKVYFCQNKDGSSKIEELKVNLFGSIENWPEDFFGDLFGEIAAKEKAALRQRRAAQ